MSDYSPTFIAIRRGEITEVSQNKIIEKLLAKSKFLSPDECWEWEGAPGSSGYSNIYFYDSSWVIHRLAYQALVRPLQDDEVLDHVCLNKLCFNPDHLDATDSKTNNRRNQRWKDIDGRWYCPSNHLVEGWNEMKYGQGKYKCRTCFNKSKRQYE